MGFSGILGIVLNDGIKRILRVVGGDRIQRIIGTVLIEWVEDIVVALLFVVEAGFGECRCDREEQRQKREEDNTHGDPPKIKTANAFSPFFAWRTAQAARKWPCQLLLIAL